MTIADINTEIRDICDADSTSLTAATLLYRVNMAYEEITALLIKETAGGRWPYGDANYTAFPTFTTALVNAQQTYDIDALFATGTYPANYQPIVILGVEVLTNGGIWIPLEPITLDDIHRQGIAQTEYYKTNGRPTQYEKRENMLVLYPAPDNGVSVTLAAGLKIFYLRTADKFTSAQVTTGTKEPGFPSSYHMLLVYKAALPFCLKNRKDRIPVILSEITRLQKELIAFISFRDRDEKKIMTMQQPQYT